MNATGEFNSTGGEFTSDLDPTFPNDVFTIQQLKSGCILFHVFGKFSFNYVKVETVS